MTDPAQTRTHATERSGLAGRARWRPAPADRVGARCRIGSPGSFSSGGRGLIGVRGLAVVARSIRAGTCLCQRVPAVRFRQCLSQRGLRHAGMRVRPSASGLEREAAGQRHVEHRVVDVDRRLGAVACCRDQRAAVVGQPKSLGVLGR